MKAAILVPYMRDLECRVLFAEFIEYRLDGIRRTVIGNDDVEVAIALPGSPTQVKSLVDVATVSSTRRSCGAWL